jgi:ABC-2 type transport system ATP-binding protein
MTERNSALRDSVSAISIRNLVKRYGQRLAVNNISLEIMPGENVAIIGPNGAGKTTIIEVLLGLHRATSGSALMLGREVVRDRARALAKVGVQLQEGRMFPMVTVRQYLSLYAGLYGLPRFDEATIDRLDIRGELDTEFGTLSGGLKQRVILALALTNDPDILLLDEPSTALDPVAKHDLWSLLESLKRPDRTIMLTSHQMDEVTRLTERVIFIRDGCVIADGTPDSLIVGANGSETLEQAFLFYMGRRP